MVREVQRVEERFKRKKKTFFLQILVALNHWKGQVRNKQTAMYFNYLVSTYNYQVLIHFLQLMAYMPFVEFEINYKKFGKRNIIFFHIKMFSQWFSLWWPQAIEIASEKLCFCSQSKLKQKFLRTFIYIRTSPLLFAY